MLTVTFTIQAYVYEKRFMQYFIFFQFLLVVLIFINFFFFTQKLLFGTENLAITQLGRNILSHTVVSSARKNLQNLQTRLMQHQRQITLSSMKVLKSASFLLNFSCDNHKKTTLMENMNRLIETLHLDQRNLTRDILRNLLKTLHFYQQLQNYTLFVRISNHVN